MMETVYYSTAESSSYPLAQVPLRETLKRKMTLELNNSDRKKSKYASLQTPIFQNEVLASPDLQMCKLASPDLENLIHNMPLNTPNIFFAKSVTDPNGSGGVDGDQYDTTGFDDALNSLRKQNQLQTTGTTTPQYTSLPQIQSIGVVTTTTTNSSISNNNNNYYAPSQSGESINSEDSMMSETSSAYGYPGSVGDISNVSSTNTKIKHESSGNSAPISPVDMESQERIKLERKRQRNRLAASKCRKRKLEKISNLEDRVNRLKKENNELSKVLERLQESVGDLKDKVMKHVQSGCQIMIAQTPPF